MPVFEHAAGGEPEIEILVRRFGWRLVGQREDHRAAILVAVELETLAGLHIGIEAFPVTPARLLAVDHRPAQAAHLVVSVEWREIVAMTAAEVAYSSNRPFCT